MYYIGKETRHSYYTSMKHFRMDKATHGNLRETKTNTLQTTGFKSRLVQTHVHIFLVSLDIFYFKHCPFQIALLDSEVGKWYQHLVDSSDSTFVPLKQSLEFQSCEWKMVTGVWVLLGGLELFVIGFLFRWLLSEVMRQSYSK